MEKIYTIYLFTFPNGKQYCGYTSKQPSRRWDNGNGYKECPLVYKAIQKYGWENVKKEIIFTTHDQQEALQYEKNTIKEKQLTNQDFGYNLDEGGRLAIGGSQFLTEDGRKRISESAKKHWQDPVFRAKMIEKCKAHPPTRECIEKGVKASAEARRGKIANNAIPVIQCDIATGAIIQEYPSATAAAIALTGIAGNNSNILKVCRGQRKTAYKYSWRFKE